MSAQHHQERHHHPDRSVLLVEDVAATRRALADLLRLRGCQVYQAADGAAGLATLRHHPEIKVVVLDLVMEGTDGWAFRREQLTDPAIADVPVIVFTAARDTETILMLLRVKAVLRKPAAVGDLLVAVDACCAEPVR